MFGFLKSGKEKSIKIDGIETPIQAEKKETILNAALREGVRFPHSCRVGGCASCKCKLKSGKVKELTESAYILNEEELAQGYILACQAVPKTDVEIELDELDLNGPSNPVVKTTGVVSKVKKLTHDISALTIDLNESISYAAGQYALLSVPGEIEEGRSYSFATVPATGGSSQIEFYIREVPGGQMSTWAQRDDIQGSVVSVEGAFGDFYLRDDKSPLLCIAGGSGLAPIKSLLEDALNYKCARDVVFLFGARTQADLYGLDEIRRLEMEWASNFKFIPVLSEEPEDSDWQGARGFVTTHIKENILPGSHAYMCGPPPMLDAAEVELLNLGISSDVVYSDKFIDKSFDKTA
ncbi:MAG: 2Fe-2S iron-sulfur cluster binding domain-containing protein [Pseudomonadales bacterium]|nr:2Fe-2S iron-sulfur cluster binding domain-containing protein [Pseudomonadales bacterium]